MPDLAEESQRAEAMAAFQSDILASSNRASVESRIRTCAKMLKHWGVDMYPPTAASISALGASLKVGGYRSAAVYLGVYKSWSARQGAEWSTACQQALADAIRSCERGLGGPVKARALPFHQLHLLPLATQPWVAGGPMRPRNSIIIGAWFLTREIELSTALASSLELSFAPEGRPKVRFHLPASKSDIKAIGTAREHGCACGDAPSPSCPAHAAWDQWSFLRREFPDRWQGEIPDPDLPLFPCHRGTACGKEAMTQHIQHAATLLGVDLVAPDGSERVSGHSLRATGAQGLAAAGVDTWAIELMGRWGSDVVRGYIREARLTQASSLARQVAASPVHLEELVTGLIRKHFGDQPAMGSGTPPGAGLPEFLMPSASLEPSAISVPSLAEPLTEFVRLARAESLQSPTATEFVVNRATGVAHRSIIGPGHGVAAAWTAACGWKYGQTVFAEFVPEADLPKDFRDYCKRCLPERRNRLQDALAAAAGT